MRPVRFTQLLLLPLQLLGPAYAHAGLSVDPARGEQTLQIPVPGRNAEICVVPKHLAAGRYFDKDSEIELRLCNIDEHKNSAVCPKLNSTNPGLDLYSLPEGGTPQQVEAARCNTAGAHKIAKYKLSSSCSYTPSILGYYHLSRMLGGIADVPPAVLRTFDLQNHIALGRAALAASASNSLIHQTWASLMARSASPWSSVHGLGRAGRAASSAIEEGLGVANAAAIALIAVKPDGSDRRCRSSRADRSLAQDGALR